MKVVRTGNKIFKPVLCLDLVTDILNSIIYIKSIIYIHIIIICFLFSCLMDKGYKPKHKYKGMAVDNLLNALAKP